MRPVPTACLPLIHQFEGQRVGFEPTRTLDPAGNAEIGWGHKLAGPHDPLWDATLTLEEADALAIEDLAGAARGVCDAVGTAIVGLNDNQYAALIDFTYNVGVGNFQSSTLCALVRAGHYTVAANEFARWVYADGKVLPGLQRRRAAEKALWLAL